MSPMARGFSSAPCGRNPALPTSNPEGPGPEIPCHPCIPGQSLVQVQPLSLASLRTGRLCCTQARAYRHAGTRSLHGCYRERTWECRGLCEALILIASGLGKAKGSFKLSNHFSSPWQACARHRHPPTPLLPSLPRHPPLATNLVFFPGETPLPYGYLLSSYYCCMSPSSALSGFYILVSATFVSSKGISPAVFILPL